MTDHVPPSLEEVWDWKQRAEQVTGPMSRREIIEFYRAQADAVIRKLNLNLPPRSAASVANEPRST